MTMSHITCLYGINDNQNWCWFSDYKTHYLYIVRWDITHY